VAELLIKNGAVYDPANRVEGDITDIAIRDGTIVESVGSGAQIIDAASMLVMAGGVDIHAHIAGAKVNAGRLMRPEDHFRDFEAKTSAARSGVGHSVPSIFTTGYRYARMGYTTVFEPATPPLETRHTHEELNDLPMLDTGCFPLFGNNSMIMEYLAAGKLEECAGYVAWMLHATKGYALKIVNPGGVEAWGWGKNVTDYDEQVPRYNITPREIVRGLCKVNKMLRLPHTIHLHPNNLGKPGNYETSIETLDSVRDLAEGKRSIHLTHIQFTGYGGRNWQSVSSEAPEIAKYVNTHDHVTLDMGQIIFTSTTTMTADGPFQFLLHTMSGNKWMNTDVEAETGSGIVPFVYKRSNSAHAVMWAIGLEAALLITDPWKIYLTTDHPNAGPFTEYPRIIAWLMSNKARSRVIAKLPRNARKRINLETVDRELTLSEIATMTRAATADALSLTKKGHLGVGADADVAVYPFKPREVDPSAEYKKVRRAFRRAALVVKAGEIVVKDGEVIKSFSGRTYWAKPHIEADVLEQVATELKSKFKKYYTVEFENYPISEDYLDHAFAVQGA